MGYRNGTFCTILCASLMFSVGCSKKVTKIGLEAKPITQGTSSKESAAQTPSDSFKVSDIDAKMKGIFVPIYFAFDKYDLSENAIASLGKIASFLKENPRVRILIEGNADEIGSDEYNMGLGEKRARVDPNHFSSAAFNTPSSFTNVHSLSGLYSFMAPAMREVFSPKFRWKTCAF